MCYLSFHNLNHINKRCSLKNEGINILKNTKVLGLNTRLEESYIYICINAYVYILVYLSFHNFHHINKRCSIKYKGLITLKAPTISIFVSSYFGSFNTKPIYTCIYIYIYIYIYMYIHVYTCIYIYKNKGTNDTKSSRDQYICFVIFWIF
jgi:hypothetical protein